MLSSAKEPSFELLIGRQRSPVAEHFHRRLTADRGGRRAVISRVHAIARRSAGNLSTVIAPAEREPGAALPWLVLHVGRLVEFLVVINAEGKAILPHGGSETSDLWREEARGHARKHHACRQPVKIGHVDAGRVSRNLRV